MKIGHRTKPRCQVAVPEFGGHTSPKIRLHASGGRVLTPSRPCLCMLITGGQS